MPTATVPSVHRLHMARINLPGKFNPPTFEDSRINVYAYLIVIGSGALLVDTGVGADNRFIIRTYEPDVTPINDQLARFDLEPGDIGHIINSHLHFDHCGNNQLFPNAEIHVQESELSAARTPSYTVREWFDYEGARISPVDGDAEISKGVQLLTSAGHSPGHQSVLVENENGNILIAAQAAYTADEFRRGGDPASQAHEGLEDEYLRSILRLKSIGAETVYFSHDRETA